MSSYIIWLDGREGRVFDLAVEEAPAAGPKVSRVLVHGHKHHEKSDPVDLFKDLAHAIQDAAEIVIVGPAESKIHFKHYLEKHFAKGVGSKVIAVEAMDHPTDNQVLAYARKFFRKYDLFHTT